MCGICGIVGLNNNISFGPDTIRGMCNEIKHRGPDGEGIYFNGEGRPSVGLGHRRLKIIDLSELGRQPMCNENADVWLVFNGEIYNFIELRKDLEAKGHKFKSKTDTEALIHLYEVYGKECVKYLRGMFAFAIWDEKEKTLLLARDRVGKKPLIYSYNNGVFCFASEFTSLLNPGLIKKEVSYEAVDYYFTFGYIPAPLTIYNDVLKLPPAHILILKQSSLQIERYWDLDYENKIKISEQDAEDEVLRLLKEAVKLRLHSDVPLGAFLSGGIDSSSIVGLMSQLSANKVKTFSIGFAEKPYDELAFARAVSRRFGTEHHEFIVRPNALEILPLLVERYGEPYADSSCIPTYYVSRQTKQYVTVALNGDGGDESFAGYERYQAMLISQRIPPLIKVLLFGFSSILPDSINARSKSRRIKRFLEAVNLSKTARYVRWVGIFNERFKSAVYSDAFRGRLTEDIARKYMEPFFSNTNLNLLDLCLRADVNTYLPYDLLVKVDITSMANSLEARSPFLDHKLMEFAAKLPAVHKLKWQSKKFILKKAVRSLIPKENIYRRKMGFGLPVGNWLRGELKPLLCEVVLSNKSLKRGYFKPQAVQEMAQAHISGREDYSFQLWSLLMLELWHQRFID